MLVRYYCDLTSWSKFSDFNAPVVVFQRVILSPGFWDRRFEECMEQHKTIASFYQHKSCGISMPSLCKTPETNNSEEEPTSLRGMEIRHHRLKLEQAWKKNLHLRRNLNVLCRMRASFWQFVIENSSPSFQDTPSTTSSCGYSVIETEL